MLGPGIAASPVAGQPSTHPYPHMLAAGHYQPALDMHTHIHPHTGEQTDHQLLAYPHWFHLLPADSCYTTCC